MIVSIIIIISLYIQKHLVQKKNNRSQENKKTVRRRKPTIRRSKKTPSTETKDKQHLTQDKTQRSLNGRTRAWSLSLRWSSHEVVVAATCRGPASWDCTVPFVGCSFSVYVQSCTDCTVRPLPLSDKTYTRQTTTC